jgi:glyoxylase-like metal-dependent hydrolase (beta-lactamase superfamily II)
MSGQPIIRAFFDEPTNTVSYLVADLATKRASIIDPVFDYDHNSGTVDTRSVEAMLKAAEEDGLTIEWALETHAHADHLSGAPYIKAKTGASIGIGEHIKDVQKIFRPIFNATDLNPDGSDFDHLFKDGERFKIGDLDVEVLHTPGTPRRTCPTRSRMRCSSVTQCSCRTTAPPAPISRVVTPISCTARSSA